MASALRKIDTQIGHDVQFQAPSNPTTSSAQRPAPRAPLRHRLAALALLLGAAGPGIGGEDFIYVVRPGDSPWNITTRYLKSLEHWPRLQRYNRILAPEAIPTGTQLRIPLDWLRSQARPVRIEDLQGRVEVVHRGVPRALERGMAVAEGSLLRTGADGSLTLRLPDGSRSLLGPDSELRLDSARQPAIAPGGQIRMELRSGHVENKVPDKSGSAW